jgi:hypothetical protein
MSRANTHFGREYSTTHIDVELPRHHKHRHEQREFVFERPHHHHHHHHNHNHLNSRIDIAEREYRSRFQPTYREEVRPAYREEVRIETTVDPPKQEIVNDKMGYYDEDGNHNANSCHSN